MTDFIFTLIFNPIETIPFIQLAGSRINIVGFIWIVSLTLATGNKIKKSKPFRDYNRTFRLLLATLVSFILVYMFYKIIDSLWQIYQILSGHAYMVSANLPSWSWTFYWLNFGLTLIIMVAISLLFFKMFDLRKNFKARTVSLLFAVITIAVWTYQLTYFPFDYASILGQQRITLFWATYPEIYVSYALLYLSFWRIKNA